MDIFNSSLTNKNAKQSRVYGADNRQNTASEISQHIELIRIIKRYEYCHGWTLLIAPDHLPKKDVLVNAGINLDKVLIIHKKHCTDVLFKSYQALKQDNFSALVVWDNLITESEMQLLKIKAEYTTTSLYFLNNKAQDEAIISH